MYCHLSTGEGGKASRALLTEDGTVKKAETGILGQDSCSIPLGYLKNHTAPLIPIHEPKFYEVAFTGLVLE